MAKKRKKQKAQRSAAVTTSESRTAEAITIAWTVTITTLVFCHLATLAVHLWLGSNPEAKKMLVLREMLLFASAVVGVLSLVLLPLVFRLREQPPPMGLTVFGAFLAIAPVLALVLRAAG